MDGNFRVRTKAENDFQARFINPVRTRPKNERSMNLRRNSVRTETSIRCFEINWNSNSMRDRRDVSNELQLNWNLKNWDMTCTDKGGFSILQGYVFFVLTCNSETKFKFNSMIEMVLYVFFPSIVACSDVLFTRSWNRCQI